MAKTKITWIVDSGGRESLHENGPLSMKESYLGHIFRKDADWFFVQASGKEHGPFTYAEAKKSGVRLVDGEYV